MITKILSIAIDKALSELYSAPLHNHTVFPQGSGPGIGPYVYLPLFLLLREFDLSFMHACSFILLSYSVQSARVVNSLPEWNHYWIPPHSGSFVSGLPLGLILFFLPSLQSIHALPYLAFSAWSTASKVFTGIPSKANTA